jgi:hypothetical protein
VDSSGWSGQGDFYVPPSALGGFINLPLGLRPRLVYVALSALYGVVGLDSVGTAGLLNGAEARKDND